jgi:hypothetical protein
MQTAHILLALGGDSGNTVPKRNVTAAEIAVLIAIHGNQAVTEIEPAGEINQSNRAELNRLRQTYGRATDADNHSIVGQLFPGAAARVFETLDELEIPDAFYKPLSRASAKSLFGGKGDHDKDGAAGGAAAPVPALEGLEALTIAKLKELAAEKNIDLGDATKKADIIAAIEAAKPVETEVEEPDDVSDMDEAKSLFN